MTPQELASYHGWSLYIHVPQSALYLLSRTYQTKKRSSGIIYNFQWPNHLRRLRESETILILTFIQGLQVGHVISPF